MKLWNSYSSSGQKWWHDYQSCTLSQKFQKKEKSIKKKIQIILQSLECVGYLCAVLWCLLWVTLPLWLEGVLLKEDHWTLLCSDWLQTRPDKPSGKPEQEAEGCPQRNLELEYSVETSHKAKSVHTTRSWVSVYTMNQKMNQHSSI